MAVQLRDALPDAPNTAVSSALRTGAERPSPDELFNALDGRLISVAARTWRVEVFGIRDVAGARWVQVGLTGDAGQLMVTRRLVAGAGVQHVVLTLSSWLADPARLRPSDGVQNVA